eukprot:TRINITY_DN1724_c0_g2_i2.p1 TRINITY_DN1724_c0_g2~~TRINITY_DN1724_c0_g2_i2.p1  ORF type:complete len:519 (+),score=153.13 TRINITY_DN1724_c0_g2_i2:265-1821(+)
MHLSAEVKSNDSEDLMSGILITEEEISNSLNMLAKLVNGNPPPYQQQILSSLNPIIGPLFNLYCFTCRSSILNVRKQIESIMKQYFLSSDNASLILKRLFVPPSLLPQNDIIHSDTNGNADFSAGSNGGVVIRVNNNKKRDFEWESKCAVQLLSEMGNEGVNGDLFVDLLSIVLSSRGVEEEESNETNRMPLLSLIMKMMETFGQSILKNVVQVCTLLKSILDSNEEDEEMIPLAVALLSQILSGNGSKIQKEEEFLLDQLLPNLEILEGHEDPKLAQIVHLLIEKITSRDPSVFGTNPEDEQHKDAEYDIPSVLKDLQSELLPTRAYALVCLRKIVLKNGPKAEENLERFLGIFRDQMRHEDSFIYLNAIQGLMSLGDLFPEKVIINLLSFFVDPKHPELERLKLGEALLYVSKRCGETLPKYAPNLMNGFLAGTKDPMGSIRASSLSNLAELCKLMRFALHPYIREILECIFSVMNADKEREVRRGAVFAITLLLRGLGRDIFELIPDQLKALCIL